MAQTSTDIPLQKLPVCLTNKLKKIANMNFVNGSQYKFVIRHQTEKIWTEFAI